MSHTSKVGLFALVALCLATFFVLRIKNIEIKRGHLHEYRVLLPDARGLIVKSTVLVKGIQVGRVSKLELVDKGIVAVLAIKRDIVLYEGAKATVSSVGLLGEKQLEIEPGDVTKPRLAHSALIPGSPSPTLDSVIGAMGRVEEDILAITGSFRTVLGGAQGQERIEVLTESVIDMTQQMRDFLATNRRETKETLVSVRAMSDALTQFAKDLNRPAATEGSQAPGTGGSGATSFSQDLRTAAANVEDISSRLRRGEGSLGQWLQSDNAAHHVDNTLDSVRDGAGAISKGVGWLGQTRFFGELRADYFPSSPSTKGQLLLDVRPPAPWFIRLGASTQPFGLLSYRVTQIQSIGANGRASTTTSQQTERSGDLGFTAMAGWRFRPLALRGGIIESRPGVGADLWFFGDRLRFTAEAWNFGTGPWRPRLRFDSTVAPWRWLGLHVGWDDALNPGAPTSSVYLGAGLQFLTD